MTPPSNTPSRITVPEFCLPATNSGTSLLTHILRSSRNAREQIEAQREHVILTREDDDDRSDA